VIVTLTIDEYAELLNDAERYRKLWAMKRFVPQKNKLQALMSFMCWCTKEQGDAAIDAVELGEPNDRDQTNSDNS
jgi:hypothetical protein